jgi:twinkle protein
MKALHSCSSLVLSQAISGSASGSVGNRASNHVHATALSDALANSASTLRPVLHSRSLFASSSSDMISNLFIPRPMRPPLRVLAGSYSVRRFHKKVLSHEELGSVNLLEIKKFLRWKAIDFRESHACLTVAIPKHLLLGDEAPPSLWNAIDEAMVDVYINKTTGLVVCPELAISDEWQKLRSFIETWHSNRRRKKTEAMDDYAKLNVLPAELPKETADFWSTCLPVEALSSQEMKDVLKHLKLPLKDFKLEDFVRFEARVSANHEQLLFPVRYVDEKASVVGLRRIWMCPDTRSLIEDNLPEGRIDVNYNRIFPFPHGLHHAVRAGNTSVLIVVSILDAIVVASRTNVTPVALAEGATFFPPDHLPFFEEFERLNFWFPRDVSTFESVAAFAKKLGETRCSSISRDTDHPSACLKSSETRSLKEILANKMKPVAHEFITTFDSLRQDVFLEMAHFEQVEGTKWKRFEGLNEMLRGFRRGELSVFSGKTGTGKTTFLSEYSVDLVCQVRREQYVVIINAMVVPRTFYQVRRSRHLV